jgi:CRISPR-associated protein Cas1
MTEISIIFPFLLSLSLTTKTRNNDGTMILTLHVPGTTVKRVQESLKVYIPAYARAKSSSTNLHLDPNEPNIDLENEKSVNENGDDGASDIAPREYDSESKNSLTNTKQIANNEPAGNPVMDNAHDENETAKLDVHVVASDSIDKVDKIDEEMHETGPSSDTEQKPTSFQVAITQLSSVIVSGNVSITISVLQHLAKCAVPVIFTEKNRPIAILNPFANHGSVRVRKEQFAAIDSERGFYIAKQIVGGALENKARLLLSLAKNRASTNLAIEQTLRDHAQAIRTGKNKLETLRYTSDPTSNRFNLLGIEGDGTKIYFAALKHVIPAAFNFSGRNRRPPRDPINAMLSLGYTILQGYISIGIAAVGLEPFAGFMHADRAGKPSLSLDLMEEFRQPVVDRLILALVTKGGIKPSHFTTTTTGVLLTDQGRDIFVTKLVKRAAPLRPSEDAAGTSGNYYKDIIKQARDVSRFLLGLEKTYSPFIMAW